MNAEEFFREFAGFEPDTPIGVEWVPFSSLKDACKAMEEYAAAKENEWNDEAVKPPCLPHLVGTGREQSDKVIAHGDGITFFAIYHHLHRGGVLAGLPERAFNRSRPTLFNRRNPALAGEW